MFGRSKTRYNKGKKLKVRKIYNKSKVQIKKSKKELVIIPEKV